MKKKIPAPLTPEQLKEKMKGIDPSKITMPKGSDLPTTEKVSKDEVSPEKFGSVELRSVGYTAPVTYVDGNGKEYPKPGGMYVYFNWSLPGFGFGEISIKTKGDKVVIDSEGLDKNFVKAMLCSLVDNAELKEIKWRKD